MGNSLSSLSGLREVVGNYHGIICDVWGVLHNGVAATQGAWEALLAARRAGLPIVLLTNAPRPSQLIADQLQEFGIPAKCYDYIISSGSVCRAEIEKEGNKPFFHIGPERDLPLFEGLEVQPSRFEDAQYIVCTGLFYDETERAEDYHRLLVAALNKRMRLFCANPDLVVDRGNRIIPCAGAIGDFYEKMGGQTIWIGKPKPYVYILSRQLIASERKLKSQSSNTTGPLRILCIGDSLRTDVAGAKEAGCDSLMTLAGIHAREVLLFGASYDRDRLESLCQYHKARPTMVMPTLLW